MDQEQEFEFRARAEKEQRLRAQQAAPSQTGGATGSWAEPEAPVDPDAHARSLAAYDRVTQGGLLNQGINEITGTIPEAAIYYGHKAAAGAAGFVAGAPHAMEGLISGDDQGARTFADVAGKVAGAVDTNPKTHGGKALVGAGNWVLEQLGKFGQWSGEQAGDIARSAGASSDNVARISALGEAATSLAPGAALEAAQIPITVGRRVLTGADAATEAKFTGSPPPSMGPPLRTDPTLDLGRANVEPRQPGDLGIDMAGRAEPGINMGAAPDNLGNPMGSPSAAAQPPLMADTRPSASILDRMIASGTEKAATRTQMSATTAKNVQDALAMDLRLTPKEMGAGLINQVAAGYAGNPKLGKANSEHNAQVVTQKLKGEFGLPPGPLHEADLKPLLAETSGSRDKIRALDITIQSDKQMKADVRAIRGEFAKAAKEFPTQFKDDAIDSLIASLSQQTEAVPGKSSSWDWMGKRSSPATEPIPAVDVEHTPGALLEFSRNLREKSVVDMRSAKSEDRALGLARRQASNAIEDLLERKLSEAGYTDLVAERQADRTKAAKIYDTMGALDDSTGLINPYDLGKMWDKGRPMSGTLETVGRLARAFKQNSMRDMRAMRDTSHFDFLDTASVYTRPPLRGVLGSKWYQKNVIGTPTYTPGMKVKLAEFANRGDPLSLGAASAINQSNFSTSDPLGLGQ